MNQIISFFQSFFCSIPRLVAVALGIVWAWLEPTLPYALLCVFAVLIDCLTAWRLNRRIKATFPKSKADGKLKSAHMFKMVSDLAIVWFCILLAGEVWISICSPTSEAYTSVSMWLPSSSFAPWLASSKTNHPAMVLHGQEPSKRLSPLRLHVTLTSTKRNWRLLSNLTRLKSTRKLSKNNVTYAVISSRP